MPRREEYQANPEKMRELARGYRAKDPERYRRQARKDHAIYRSKPEGVFKNAARAATLALQRQVCEIKNCGVLGEAHHDDYTKRLDVRWLCRIHHEEFHHNGEKVEVKREYADTIVVSSPFVTCYSCRGHGLQDGIDGPVDCWICKGNCVIRDRDDKGRFISHPTTMYHLGDGVYAYVKPHKEREKC